MPAPEFNADKQFRKYCRQCGEDELLFLARYYPEAIARNMVEEKDHELVGNDVELARTRMRHRENLWRGVVVVQELKDRRGRSR